MIVTIDGPAGAGKSSIARQVAERLDFEFLDTGAMYRAVTLGAMRQGIDWTDHDQLLDYARGVKLRWEDCRIYLDGEDVSESIRLPEVTQHIRHVADPPEIRGQLSAHQRVIAKGRDIVTEGRDQGAEVFPDAECKIFLTASPEERARRRCRQLLDQGKPVAYEDVLTAQNQRDLEDRLRPVGRLRPAADAKVVSTDGMSADEVLSAVLGIVQNVLESAAQTR
ncbi:MAG: (d)CMP kinase [Planctomycetota bacterium]